MGETLLLMTSMGNGGGAGEIGQEGEGHAHTSNMYCKHQPVLLQSLWEQKDIKKLRW